MKKSAKFLAVLLTISAGLFGHEGHDHNKEVYSAKPTESTTPAKVGNTAHAYVTVPGWGKVPNQPHIGSTHGGIAVDKAGNVYVSTDGNKDLAVFTSEGKYLRSFGKEFARIHGMVINTEGDKQYLYCAAMSQVYKVDLKGNVVLRLKGTDLEKANQWRRATAIAVSPAGDIFVADGYGSSRIFKYDKTGKFVKVFGTKGRKDGQFVTSHGLMVDSRNAEKPVLIVCDRENRRLQLFDMDGNFIKVAITGLRRPCSLSIWKDYIAVAELQGRVVVLDKEYKIVAKLGDNPNKKQWARFPVDPKQWKEGIFTAPHGISFDKDGNIYVMDWNRWGRVTKLKRQK